MKFKSSKRLDDFTTIIIEDEVLSRRFMIGDQEGFVHESVFVKKPVGRPRRIASWFHRGEDAHRIVCVLERYEMQSTIGEVHALDPFNASKQACALSLEHLVAQKCLMQEQLRAIPPGQALAVSMAIKCMLNAIGQTERALRCYLDYEDALGSKRR